MYKYNLCDCNDPFNIFNSLDGLDGIVHCLGTCDAHWALSSTCPLVHQEFLGTCDMLQATYLLQ